MSQYSAGQGDTYFAAFDPTTGQRTGPGAYLTVGQNIAFAQVGGASFQPEAAVAVPEPTSWALMLVGVTLMALTVGGWRHATQPPGR